jgi:hypothetical protein
VRGRLHACRDQSDYADSDAAITAARDSSRLRSA